MQKIILLLFLCLFFSCKDSSSSSYGDDTDYESSSDFDYSSGYDDSEDEETDESFEDGNYWATVDYFNPETGYSATYTLEVEVYDNEVTTIYFPNDGYLDEDHIWAEELDENGYARVQGEEGKTYEVQLDY